MRKRGVVILMAAALTASVPATALADQFAGQIALNGEAASEDVADEDSQVDMRQKQERKNLIQKNRNPKSQRKR